MLTYAEARMLTYAHVCSRMLTYADVRMLTQLQNQNQNLLRIKEEMAAGGDKAHVEQATIIYVCVCTYICLHGYIYIY